MPSEGGWSSCIDLLADGDDVGYFGRVPAA